MFILYAIVAGLIAGFVLGGGLDGLAAVRLRWLPLAIAGLGVQVVLFTDPGWSLAGGLAPAIYVASTAAVLAVVLANVRVPGVALVAAGAISNLAAILANGGSMPADPGALASLGLTAGGATNSVVVADPALRPLTDVFALPAWLPMANVFSLGDVLIGLGIAIAIAASMRRPGTEAEGAGTSGPETPRAKAAGAGTGPQVAEAAEATDLAGTATPRTEDPVR